jgi:hypothetical protein
MALTRFLMFFEKKPLGTRAYLLSSPLSDSVGFGMRVEYHRSGIISAERRSIFLKI